MRRFFVFLFILGGSIWFGASIARMMVGYDVFIPGTLLLKEQPELLRLHTIRLFTLLGGWTGWSFAMAAVGGIGSILTHSRLFRTQGWMLMCSILFVLVVGVEAWVGWEDYKLYTLFDANNGIALAQTPDIITAFLARQNNTAMNIAHGMALLSAATIVLFASFRPLRKS